MANKIQTVKGTREFYPEEMALRNYLYSKVRAASQAFGYQEYDGPFIEPIDLYAAKSGEELVKKQSFTFADRGGDLVTLRPELTPSLARMIAARQNELTYPVRWWSFGPFWRYEQPQRGRPFDPVHKTGISACRIVVKRRISSQICSGVLPFV